MASSMPEAEVVRVLAQAYRSALEVHVDGGWGVDALLGRCTRAHGDLDVAIPLDQVARLRSVLGDLGYVETHRDGSTEANFVLAAGSFQVDVHAYRFVGDEPVASVGIAYPRAALSGTGRIGELAVRCIAAEWVLRFHAGYELDADDLADVIAVAEAFGLPLLPEHIAARHRLIG
jgi:lincosamide nucleotidyltransferase A/C/D/E